MSGPSKAHTVFVFAGVITVVFLLAAYVNLASRSRHAPRVLRRDLDALEQRVRALEARRRGQVRQRVRRDVWGMSKRGIHKIERVVRQIIPAESGRFVMAYDIPETHESRVVPVVAWALVEDGGLTYLEAVEAPSKSPQWDGGTCLSFSIERRAGNFVGMIDLAEYPDADELSKAIGKLVEEHRRDAEEDAKLAVGRVGLPR